MSDIDAHDGLRALVDAANETATSSSAHSFVRWDDDRERDAYAVLPGGSLHRESDLLARHNAATIRADIEARFPGALLIESMSDWAVGWTETAFVPVRDETGGIHPAAIAACDWATALDSYPIADEDTYSEAEHEEALDVLERCYDVPAERCADVLGWLNDNGCDCSPDYLTQRDVDEACAELGIAL